MHKHKRGLTETTMSLLGCGHTQEVMAMAEERDVDQSVRRRLRLGIVGIGVGASEILPQMEAMPDIQLMGRGLTNLTL